MLQQICNEMRTVKQKLKAFKVNMGGVILDQALPHKKLDQIDPFLLIHHWRDDMKGGKKQSEVGVGPHPHCGFAPVTFIFKGGVHHRDSKGHESIVKEGGVQWMNSGSGIVHSERPMKSLAQDGGEFEIIQIWVNAPASKKREPANYQALPLEETPQFKSQDGLVKVGLVAGQIQGLKGNISTYSEMTILRLDYQAGGTITLDIPQDFNTLIYNLNGSLTAGGEIMGTKDLFEFNKDGNSITLTTQSSGRAILLSAKPIEEPVATYGPFVMNTQKEIMQAMQDYQEGKMGELVETFN